jgi:alcohol dehydrogenase, propanol-preferring
LTPSKCRHPTSFSVAARSSAPSPGTPIQNEDNPAFSAAHGIAPMIEVLPFEDAPKAYERMMSGHARFRPE